MSRGKDFDIEMSKQNDGDVKVFNDINAIRNSIHNIFLTYQGTRRMLPEFADGPYDLLFEPMDEQTAMRIGEILVSGLERWENRIIINNLHVEANPDRHVYRILLNVSMKGVENSEILIEEILRAQ